ncbi:MAG TPA: ribokinase [Terriglobales bacterium]|nr:ribokinase [Terriglobales bacterium]
MTATPKPVVVIGSVNLDLVAGVPHIPLTGETVTGASLERFYGGKGANQAVSVAKLDYPAHLIAKVGDDENGELLRRGLRQAGVDVRCLISSLEAPSGTALIFSDPAGQNSIVIIPGANGCLLPVDVARFESLINSAGIILLQLEIPLQTVIYVAEMGYRKNIPVMLDPAPARELPPKLLLQLAWLTPNEVEAAALCGHPGEGLAPEHVPQCAEQLLSRGPRHVVIKLGAQGAYLATRDGLRQHIPAYRVRAVDTTAAGDAFNGALAVALLQGKSPVEAAGFASAVAALSATKKGAQPSMPTALEVSKFLKKAKVTNGPILATA